MIAPQTPPLSVLIAAEAMAGADVAAQRLGSVAAIEANHIVRAHRLPNRDSWGSDFLRLGRLPKLTKRSMC